MTATKAMLKFTAAWQNKVTKGSGYITTYLVEKVGGVASTASIGFDETPRGLYARIGENTERGCMYDELGNLKADKTTGVHAFEVDVEAFLSKYSIEVRLNNAYSKRVKDKEGVTEMVEAGTREEYWIRNRSSEELRSLLAIESKMNRVQPAKVEIELQKQAEAQTGDLSLPAGSLPNPTVVEGQQQPVQTDAPPF